MKTAIAGTLALMFLLGWPTQGAEGTPSTVVVPAGSNTVLTITNFVRIQKFILGQGKRQTFCTKFNNNPYWAFPEFNAYLSPPDQGNINCEIGRSEFNTLVIQEQKSRSNTRYWHIVLDQTKKQLRVVQYYAKTDPQVLIKEATEVFLKALAEIERQTSSSKANLSRNIPITDLDPFTIQLKEEWMGKQVAEVLRGKEATHVVILYTRASAANKPWLVARILKMWESKSILVAESELKRDQPMPRLSALVILKDGQVLRFEFWSKIGILSSSEGYAEFDLGE